MYSTAIAWETYVPLDCLLDNASKSHSHFNPLVFISKYIKFILLKVASFSKRLHAFVSAALSLYFSVQIVNHAIWNFTSVIYNSSSFRKFEKPFRCVINWPIGNKFVCTKMIICVVDPAFIHSFSLFPSPFSAHSQSFHLRSNRLS